MKLRVQASVRVFLYAQTELPCDADGRFDFGVDVGRLERRQRVGKTRQQIA